MHGPYVVVEDEEEYRKFLVSELGIHRLASKKDVELIGVKKPTLKKQARAVCLKGKNSPFP